MSKLIGAVTPSKCAEPKVSVYSSLDGVECNFVIGGITLSPVDARTYAMLLNVAADEVERMQATNIAPGFYWVRWSKPTNPLFPPFIAQRMDDEWWTAGASSVEASDSITIICRVSEP
jgi:hypothetical protein